MNAERDELLAVLADAGARFNALARRVPAPSAPVRNSQWTTAELVAHVAAGVDAYARYLEGETEPWVDISDLSGGSLTASNAARLVEEVERDVAVLARRSDARLAQLLALAQTRSLDEIVPWHGQPEPLRCHLGSSLGEVLLHGRDLAAAIGAPWEISKREATLVIQNIAPLFPTLVNPDTTRAVRVSIRVKIRGGPTIPLVFDCGSLTVDRDAKKFDATISAEPVAFLLVAYGRRSQWSEAARGGIVAWGPRPWRALKLTTYLVNP